MRCSWQFPCVHLLWKHTTVISNRMVIITVDELLKKSLLKSIKHTLPWTGPLVKKESLAVSSAEWKRPLSQQDRYQASFRHNGCFFSLSFISKQSLVEFFLCLHYFGSIILNIHISTNTDWPPRLLEKSFRSTPGFRLRNSGPLKSSLPLSTGSGLTSTVPV